MRRIVPLPATLLALHLLAGLASAQWCGHYPVPCAPNFQNTLPYYYTTKYCMTYGPNYYVYPPFAPYQGVLPGPKQQPRYECGPSGLEVMQARAMGVAAFPSHLYARGPRDFFMIDTDPRSSPFTYGLTNFPSANSAAVAPSPYEP